MSNPTKYRNTQILTGQIKLSSLNSIYNRVNLLKSKNKSRKLIQHKQSNYSNQNYQNLYQQNSIIWKQNNGSKINNDQNNKYQENKYYQNQIDISNSKYKDNENYQGNINMKMNQMQNQNSFYVLNNKNSNLYNKTLKNRKLVENKQTDKQYQTYFWPSKNQKNNNYNYQTNNQHYNTSENLKRQISINNNLKGINPTNSFVRHKSNSTNNRVFLMSGYQKFRKFPSQTINVIKPQNQTTPNQFNNSSVTKRPLTSSLNSSINKGNIEFRINGKSQQKKIRNKLKSTLERVTKQSRISHKNIVQKKLSQSRTSLTLIKGSDRLQIYKKQMQKFQKLYECLSQVLGSIKQGLFEVEKSISEYANYIQNKNLSFIDDFLVDKQPKLQKLVRSCRLHQTLSICYLFLEIAQQKMQDNQSYLVNFIGHSLSNLLLTVRLYIIKEGKPEFQSSEFEKAIDLLEISTFGERLYSLDDILLRIQHNNQIITIIHKRLGRHNEKFQTCIRNFLKGSQRKQYACSLCVHYIFEYLSMHIHELQMLNISPSLQLAPQPYAPPQEKEYTLIIEPVGILQKNGKFRPYLNQFIKWANKNFDLILWTWQLPIAIKQIMDTLQPYTISRLYRYHCIVQNNIFIKDLSRLGRDLQNVIIVDFDKRIFPRQRDHGIQCRWKGNSNDRNLLILSQILQQMIKSKTNVHDTLTFYSEQLHAIRGY